MNKVLIAFLFFFATITTTCFAQSAVSLPDENGMVPAVEYPYFPGRQYAFVWRNWTVVPVQRLAEVLGTTPGNVSALAASMGLPAQGAIEPQWNDSRGYITVLRRNWHLLPYEQLLTLLGISREELAWRLIEDDFLLVKLGNRKPYCLPLRYEKPTVQMEQRAKQIAQWTGSAGDSIFDSETPRFAFTDEFTQVRTKAVKKKPTPVGKPGDEGFDLRLIFSYFAAYGDPLMDPELSSYPEGLLQRLAETGVNGIWIHSVLRTLVTPEGVFPGTEDAPQRIAGLKHLVDRAAKYGIGVYLYVNEPRAMPGVFYESDPQRKAFQGIPGGDQWAMCTSVPEVKNWLSRSLESVFRNVPGLAGVFTITASENLTSCVSHGRHSQCERCKNHTYAELITDVNTAIAEGVTRGNPDAKVLVWDWGWDDSQAREIINHLPKNCWLMSVSEWALPIERGGIPSVVGEYSLSAVGPGPRAVQHWKYAKEAGLKTVAKVQVNASWEMAVVPAVPVMYLVAQHAENLASVATDGVMLSWSLGGYPSANLELFQSYRKGSKKEENVRLLAEKQYGKRAAPLVCEAWSLFSEAFKEFPYHGQTLYSGPQHMGPANPLYTEPTGYPASMVGIPYDALDDWRWVYPAEVFAAQFDKIAAGFEQGCARLNDALPLAKGECREKLQQELGRARAVGIHCASSANQVRFTDARNRFRATDDPTQRAALVKIMREAAESEAELVRVLLPLVQCDPAIGYESSNHYFYIPQDLREKQLNIGYVLEWLDRQI